MSQSLTSAQSLALGRWLAAVQQACVENQITFTHGAIMLKDGPMLDLDNTDSELLRVVV